MISTPDRQSAVALINEAVGNGSRKSPACREIGITLRTFERWTHESEIRTDRRPCATRPVPANQLTAAERTQALEIVNEPRFASLPPTQIVPILADEGRYIASKSTVYRILHEEDQLHHRGPARAQPSSSTPPLRHRTQPALCLGHHLSAGADPTPNWRNSGSNPPTAAPA